MASSAARDEIAFNGISLSLVNAAGLKQRPILQVVSVARAVMDACQPHVVNDARHQLRQMTRRRHLQRRGVEVRDANAQALGRQLAAKQRDPLRPANIPA